MNRRAFVFASLVAATLPATTHAGSTIKVIYVGGQDCPPCTRWRNTYLEKWRASREYQQVDWFEIEPPKLKEAYQERFWPHELRPILDRLPRKSTTPRFLIVEDGRLLANLTGSNNWPQIVAELKKLLRE